MYSRKFAAKAGASSVDAASAAERLVPALAIGPPATFNRRVTCVYTPGFLAAAPGRARYSRRGYGRRARSAGGAARYW